MVYVMIVTSFWTKSEIIEWYWRWYQYPLYCYVWTLAGPHLERDSVLPKGHQVLNLVALDITRVSLPDGDYPVPKSPTVASISLGGTADGECCSKSIYPSWYCVSRQVCSELLVEKPVFVMRLFTIISSYGNTDYDARSSFSNMVLALYLGSWSTRPYLSSVKSGTSIACPHVTGAIAAILGRALLVVTSPKVLIK